MKKINSLKSIITIIVIGMLFAGCTFKADLDSRYLRGGGAKSSSDGDYAVVLSCD